MASDPVMRSLEQKTIEELKVIWLSKPTDNYHQKRLDAIKEILQRKDLAFDSNGNIISTKILMTTSTHFEGYSVVETIDIITAECAFGINFIEDMITSFVDVIGGRDSVTQDTLREARKTCLRELKNEAFKVGANAVIAVDLDYSQFSGKGKSMLFLVASGTAVKIEPIVK